MLFRHRSQDVTEIIIVRTDIRDIVVKKDAAAAGDECFYRLALLGCDPVGEKIISSTSSSFPTVRESGVRVVSGGMAGIKSVP